MTVGDQRVERRGVISTGWVYFFGALGAVLFGYDTGVISGAILGIQRDFALDPLVQGFVVSSILVGAAIGSGVCGPLADRWGRRRVLIGGAVVFGVGAVGAALSPTAEVLVAWRTVLGLAVGAAAVLVPLYLSEMSPTRVRGAVAGLNQLMIMVGILLASVVNFLLDDGWRWMLAAGVVPSVILLVGITLLPETPRWLVRQGRDGEALALLRRMRPASEVEPELAEIREVEARSREEFRGVRALLRPSVRPVVLIGIVLAIFQQVEGINVIIYYLPTTLTANGLTPAAAVAINIGIGVINVLVTVAALRIVDRVGRRPLLLAGSAGMVVSLGAIALAYLVHPPASPDQATTAQLVVTVVGSAGFIVSYAISWGPVLWIVLGEIFPMRVRGSAMAVSTIALWVADIAVSLSFPVMLSGVGQGPTFLMYTVICLASYFFVRRFVTETKGRSLERIELDLLRGRRATT